jgi:hypothetical protein
MEYQQIPGGAWRAAPVLWRFFSTRRQVGNGGVFPLQERPPANKCAGISAMILVTPEVKRRISR